MPIEEAAALVVDLTYEENLLLNALLREILAADADEKA